MAIRWHCRSAGGCGRGGREAVFALWAIIPPLRPEGSIGLEESLMYEPHRKLLVPSVFASLLWGLLATSCYSDLPADTAVLAAEESAVTQRTVTLALDLDPAARPDWGAARAEVRHTLFGGPVLFQGTLDDATGWERTVRIRLPRQENALAIIAETRDGLASPDRSHRW